jgi:arginine N-succinyltransferase
MFLLRPARPSDVDSLLELAVFLNSFNLPANEEFLSGRLERSERTFAMARRPAEGREYQFALEDGAGNVVGTCAILSKHGTPQIPHYYLEVGREDRYARSIDVHAEHVTLQLRRDPDGPSELGALVLHPDVRGQPGSPGKLLSWGRFAFIALHRECFEAALIAEMRAAFDPLGRNLFWEAFGERFTGLDYEEADHRSAVDKSFIQDLFPSSKIYASLLPPEVVELLGEVHEETRAAVHLLEQAGFEWNGQVDPFDAGPYYGAPTDETVPVRETVRAVVGPDEPGGEARPTIVSTGAGSRFRAVAAPAGRDGTTARLPKDVLQRLDVGEGDEVGLTPLPQRNPRG